MEITKSEQFTEYTIEKDNFVAVNSYTINNFTGRQNITSTYKVKDNDTILTTSVMSYDDTEHMFISIYENDKITKNLYDFVVYNIDETLKYFKMYNDDTE